METLSMIGFKKMYKDLNPDCVTFATVNQKYGELENFKITQRYNKMVCVLAPFNSISFINEQGNIAFSGVKRIEYSEAAIGVRFKITCEHYDDSEEDKSYIVLADKIGWNEELANKIIWSGSYK